MFGSLGGSEVILLFVIALLLFGPRRLPEIGRTLGKAMADFRRATNEFKTSLEREVELDSLKETKRAIESTARPDTLARGMIADVVAATTLTPEDSRKAPETTEAPETGAKPEASPAASDGGPDTVH
ncbi:MAG TPA: twin-arginine translocase TatA/TatE family subunit [Candidatus Polarisedimenticolaceae bacterium]|nr:twin-arginine translocase TatA/TatE family subunit [Candidatus Polarisedimenticolaceae bacterium]